MIKPFSRQSEKIETVKSVTEATTRFSFVTTPLRNPPLDAWVDVHHDTFLKSYTDADVRLLYSAVPWQERRTFMGSPVPRIEVAMWNPLLPRREGKWAYRYSKRDYVVKHAEEGTPVHTLLTELFSKVPPEYPFALLVGYENARDSVDAHQDLGHGSHPIHSFTLYESKTEDGVAVLPRHFVISPLKSKFKLLDLEMPHGTWAVMGGTHFQDPKKGLYHSVPKAKTPAGKRINITIRAIDDSLFADVSLRPL